MPTKAALKLWSCRWAWWLWWWLWWSCCIKIAELSLVQRLVVLRENCGAVVGRSARQVGRRMVQRLVVLR